MDYKKKSLNKLNQKVS